MKFNFRKIASVLASVVMIGSTVGIAAAANYPAPFVSGGAHDVAIVYGSGAAFSDGLASESLTRDLQVELAKQTATGGTSTGATASGGDSINLATSARKVYYGDTLLTARTSLSASEMPTVLADGKITDLAGTAYSYTQSIKPGPAAITFGNSGGDLTDPVLYVDAGNSGALTPGHLYNYTLSFTKNINVSDATNVQGQKINILGVDYVIGASSTNSTLYLYGSGESVTLAGAESKTITIAGKEHTIELVGATGTTTAKITLNGISKTVTKGSSYAFAGDLNVYVKDVTYQAYAGGVQNAELIVGANTLLLTNGQTVKQGADQTSIQGTLVTITAAAPGIISGFSVAVAPQKTATDDIQAGKTFSDTVFGGLKIQFAGVVPALDATSRTTVKVDTDNTQTASVTFTSARAGSKGEQKLQYVYDNDTTATVTQPLLARKTVGTNSKGLIHVLEGEQAQVSDWIVVNAGDAGTILEVTDISASGGATATVRLTDVITQEYSDQTLTLTSGQFLKSGVNFFGGTGYTLTMPSVTAATTGAYANNSVNISWTTTANTRTIFPRIKLANGGWMALLTQTNVTADATAAAQFTTNLILPDGQTTLATTGTAVTNASRNVYANGIVWGVLSAQTDGGANTTVFRNITLGGAECNFNATLGPSILVIEPKKWNDGSYGDYICVPLTTAGTKEIAIARSTLNGTDSGFVSYNSDTYKSQAVDQFGAIVTDEQRTNENGVATIKIPSSQMYADVLFTAPGATVTAGSAGTGTVSELGDVIVKDSEVSSVSTKNLVVVGGSCINTVAAKILESGTPLCGADFTAKAGVGANQALVKVVTSPYAADKVAMLVAGYEAADTTKAVKYVTTEKPATDTNSTKKLSTSATVATVVV